MLATASLHPRFEVLGRRNVCFCDRLEDVKYTTPTTTSPPIFECDQPSAPAFLAHKAGKSQGSTHRSTLAETEQQNDPAITAQGHHRQEPTLGIPSRRVFGRGRFRCPLRKAATHRIPQGGFARVYEVKDVRGTRHACKVVTKTSLKTKKAKTKVCLSERSRSSCSHLTSCTPKSRSIARWHTPTSSAFTNVLKTTITST